MNDFVLVSRWSWVYWWLFS